MQKYDYSYNMNGLADNPVCYFSVSFSVFLDFLNTRGGRTHGLTVITRSPAIAEGPRDAGVPVEIW